MNSTLLPILATAITLFAIPLIIHRAILFGFRAPRLIEQGSPDDFGLAHREIDIQTCRGKKLFAWWIPSTTEDSVMAPTIIIMHGWGSNAELMLPLATPFHQSGLNVLLLDARDHGRSDSDNFSSLPRFAEDVAGAIDWIKSQPEILSNHIILLGHSVGAGAVLFEASKRDDISAVISLSAFAHPEWMMRRYLDEFWYPTFLTLGILRYVEWMIGHRFEAIAPMNTVCTVECPVLLVHGTADTTVPMSDALAIRDNCNKNSLELLLIEDADHESVDKIEEHAEQLVEFLTRVGVVG
ncbi:MAG: alpha/beta fold hydrolase [Gammaproteobacteria bacterium]|nr:alpha/beta fold hydrolase [Gammaproteobacteria bacterium]